MLMIAIFSGADCCDGSNGLQVCSPNADTSALSMNTIYQEQDNWCWAACGEMVMEFKGAGNMTQCDQASDVVNPSNCCQDPLPSECNFGGIPQFLRYGFRVDSISRALTLKETKEQIDCKESPICAIWNYLFGGSHMVVVSGYTKIDGEDHIIVRNPSRNYLGVLVSFIPYPEYVESGYYTHGMNYYNIAPSESSH